MRRAQRKYPIGLIDSDWGGTPIEVWMSPAALAKCNPNATPVAAASAAVAVPPDASAKAHPLFGAPTAHSVLWNAMIHPFLNMTIYGAAWYQGESNANAPSTSHAVPWLGCSCGMPVSTPCHAHPHPLPATCGGAWWCAAGAAPDSYNCTFPAMINDWRLKWNEGTQGEANPLFPFGFVQVGGAASCVGHASQPRAAAADAWVTLYVCMIANSTPGLVLRSWRRTGSPT